MYATAELYEKNDISFYVTLVWPSLPEIVGTIISKVTILHF